MVLANLRSWNIQLNHPLQIGIKQSELNEQLKEYIGEWRNQRQKEEDELKRLKEKQVKRKEIRAEQDKKLAAEKKAEEDRLKKEAAEKKAAEEEKKKQEMLAAEIKRQEEISEMSDMLSVSTYLLYP